MYVCIYIFDIKNIYFKGLINTFPILNNRNNFNGLNNQLKIEVKLDL